MKFYKIWRTYSCSLLRTQHTTTVAFPTKPVQTLTVRETFYFNDVLQNWNRPLVECDGESLTIRLLLQPSVSGVAVSLLVSGLTVDILSTFCGVFMVQCVKLMLIIFEFRVLLFDCFVYRQNVTGLKRLPGMDITQKLQS